MNKILITRRDGRVMTALWDGSRVLEFQFEEEESPLCVGDIRLGRIRDVVKNIQAAFVEVKPGCLCFLPLAPERLKQIRPGMELPVQITREAVKTKDPVASEQISLSGRLLVLITDRPRIAISSRLEDPERREALKALLVRYPEEEGVGFIVRTNAAEVEDAAILAEADRLLAEYRRITEDAKHRTVFSLLKEGSPAWLGSVRDARAGTIDAVITDQDDLYDILLRENESGEWLAPEQILCYRDPYPMEKLYRTEHFLEMALSRRIWLKSGGYLVIDYTEAMTVIDVNSGKYDGHRGKEEALLRINCEAAREIALQLRLRNLSGIILVDFIDLEEADSRRILEETLTEALRADRQKTVLVDFTALGLAEITRKKERRPLHEVLRKPKMAAE